VVQLHLRATRQGSVGKPLCLLLSQCTALLFCVCVWGREGITEDFHCDLATCICFTSQNLYTTLNVTEEFKEAISHVEHIHFDVCRRSFQIVVLRLSFIRSTTIQY
jgi:hypothetical protein